jgi:type VI secretion system secreted protein VgrG
MANTPTQTNRLGSFKSALGDDKLVLLRATVTEGLSELFEIQVDALSEDPNIDFNSAIGEKCCLAVAANDGSKRYFHGIMTAAQWTGKHRKLNSYRITARPWLWLLSHSTNCRIFKDKTAPDIIKAVLGDSKYSEVSDFKQTLSQSYEPIRYCVQYRETDLAFVSRLMEEFGIYYYFDHTDNAHQAVLVDSMSAHQPKLGLESVPHLVVDSGHVTQKEHYKAWVSERTFHSGKVVIKDYDFKKPGNKLEEQSAGGGGYKNDKLEIYDYPGRFKVSSLGSALAKVRLESIQAGDKRFYAIGDSVFSMPGKLVSLTGHDVSDFNARYLIVRATHHYSGNDYSSGGLGLDEEPYSGRYEFLPFTVPFRAPQVTQRPVIHGPQTAVVCGSGEIDFDDDGCIMVQFHWDRDKVESRRVRVAQVWSGKSWGGHFIPRVGQEVIVQFIEGDPDRPMVIGTVYNGEHAIPYTKSSEREVSGFKSNSSTGGGGFNEFVFDDKKGSEKVRVHAQKDLLATVLNDEIRDTKHDLSRHVGNNETAKIDNVLKIEAGNLIEIIVGQSKITMDKQSITLKSMMIKIEAEVMLEEKSLMTTVKGDAMLTLKGGIVLINT